MIINDKGGKVIHKDSEKRKIDKGRRSIKI
jgi:hypothetical protein